jgi:carbamoyltransferase
VNDGEIIAAVQEERFTRKEHDVDFPINAINYCLQEERRRRQQEFNLILKTGRYRCSLTR